MNWPFLTRKDIAGIVVAIVVLGVAIFASVIGPQLARKTNYGFGPDWDCNNPGKGGLTCIKRPAAATNPN